MHFYGAEKPRCSRIFKCCLAVDRDRLESDAVIQWQSEVHACIHAAGNFVRLQTERRGKAKGFLIEQLEGGGGTW